MLKIERPHGMNKKFKNDVIKHRKLLLILYLVGLIGGLSDALFSVLNIALGNTSKFMGSMNILLGAICSGLFIALFVMTAIKK